MKKPKDNIKQVPIVDKKYDPSKDSDIKNPTKNLSKIQIEKIRREVQDLYNQYLNDSKNKKSEDNQ